jgi:hypothetical protein
MAWQLRGLPESAGFAASLTVHFPGRNLSRLSSKPQTEATNETATGQQFPSIHFRDKRIVRGPKK